MSVSTTLNKVIYTGNGTTTVFGYTFYVLDEDDITLYLVDVATEVQTLITTNFTLSPTGGSFPATGGTVTYPAFGTPLDSTKKIVILRESDLLQPTVYPTNTALKPKVVEKSFDRITMQLQQVAEEVDRSVKVGVGSGSDPDDLLDQINTSVANAAASKTASSNSATSASNSALSASTSATNASNSALAASTSATNASNSALSASTSATSASNSALAAANSAAIASNPASAAPAYFRRGIPFAQSPNRKILSPNRMWVNIGTAGYALEAQQTIDIDNYAAWDTKAATWQAATAYAINDCVIPATPNGYIYRCTTAGTTNTTPPTFLPTTVGATVTDGTAVWTCKLDYAYAPTIGTRADSTAVTVGTLVRPATINGYAYRCTTAGTTAATAPTFPITVGATVTDGTVVWTCQLGHNRAGRNFYIYACAPTTGITPVLTISDNSTIPLRYTTTNSRKVGGFHCLCADVGTISGHTLTGYVAGDILPASVWDLVNKPICAPEGMVYDAGTDRWVDIYLSSVQSGALASTFDATTADGTSAEKFHWYKGVDWLSRIKKNLLTQREFMSASSGSNQGTSILGIADPNTTGGHCDTAGRRMISNLGCEDMCGALWQWGCEGGGGNTGGAWYAAYDANDTGVAGQHYQEPCRAILGGGWAFGAGCGSRGSVWSHGPLGLYADFGLRGCAEPVRVA